MSVGVCQVWDLRNMRSPEAGVRLDSAVNRVSVSERGVVAIPHDNRAVRLYTLSGSAFLLPCLITERHRWSPGLRIARLPRANAHRRMVTAAAWLRNALFTVGFDSQLLAWQYTPPKDAN